MMLRWLPEMNAWGCDRCRVTFPAQAQPAQPPPQQPQYQQPPQQYGQPPMQYGHAPGAPMPTQGGGKGKWIAIGAGVAVLGGVGVVLALTLGGKGGGASSSDDAVKQLFTAATAGDDAKLVSLSGAESLDSLLDCKDPKDKEDQAGDLKKAGERMKKDAASWKGVEVEVVTIENSGEPDVMKKGATDHGCTFTAEAVAQPVKVALNVKKGSGPKRRIERELEVIETGDKYYVVRAPDEYHDDEGDELGPDGKPAGDADLTKMLAIRDHACACKDAACAEAVAKEMSEFSQTVVEKYKGKAPPQKMVDAGKEYFDCVAKAASADPPPPPPDEPPAPAPVANVDRSSREIIIAQAADAAAAGDADAFFALTDMGVIEAALDCGDTTTDAVAEMRSSSQTVASNWKGTGAKIKGMAPGQHLSLQPGDPFGECKAKKSMDVDQCDVVLSVTSGGEKKTITTQVIVAMLDGKWYLVDWPAQPE
jgi:hypothetical protein